MTPSGAPSTPPRGDRRGLLLPVSFLVLLGAAAVGGPPGPRRGSEDEPRETPVSVQLHVHGSFSEGVGSLDSHDHEAADLGVDVVWWSDHDFRIASYRHASRFDFAAASEPVHQGEPWAAEDERSAHDKWVDLEPAVGFARGTAVLAEDGRGEGGSFLRLTCTPTRKLRKGSMSVVLGADRGFLRRPLAAGVHLKLLVRPERVSDGAVAFVDVLLSEHPVKGSMKRPGLRYLFGSEAALAAGLEDAEPLRPRLGRVVVEGRWNEVELDLTKDVVAAFPEMLGEDNALVRLSLGIETLLDRTTVAFDDVALVHDRAGDEVYARQAELIEEVDRRSPTVVHHQGVELSYNTYHLNEFGLASRLPDFEALRLGSREQPDPPAWRTARVIEDAHARGSLVSWNHMYGTSWAGAGEKASEEEDLEDLDDEGNRRPRRTREEVLADFRENRLFGADLLEVGYRARGGHGIEDHLWVWDGLGAAGIRPTGTGVSDTHGGPTGRWNRANGNTFVSWIWSTSMEKPDLLRGLEAGRVFFGDPVRFDGELDLTTDRGHRMGDLVLTDRERVPVAARLVGVAEGDRLRWVTARGAGEWLPATGDAWNGELLVDTAADRFARLEVWTGDGVAKLFSNPIHFTADPADVDRPPRLALDLEGLATVGSRRGLRVTGFGTLGERGLALEVEAEDGRLELALDPERWAEPRLGDLAGEATLADGRWTLLGARGAGRLELERR